MRHIAFGGMAADSDIRRNDNNDRGIWDRMKERTARAYELMKEKAGVVLTSLTLAVAAPAVASSGCYGSSTVAGDAQEEDGGNESDGAVDIEEADSDVPDSIEDRDEDAREDASDVTETPDMDADVVADASDAEDVEDSEDSSDVPDASLTCHDGRVGPLAGSIDPTYARSDLRDATFEGPSSGYSIQGDMTTEAGMQVVGAMTVLGRCQLSDASAAIVPSGSALNVTPEVAVTIGSTSWRATVPNPGGDVCPPLLYADRPLRVVNLDQLTIPNNADYDGVPSQAEFTLYPIQVLLSVDGVVGASSSVPVPGSSFAPAKTVSAITSPEPPLEINVHAYGAGGEVDHTYGMIPPVVASRILALYPKATGDSQMYGVNWIVPSSAITWCARCAGRDTLSIIIPGEAICRANDGCGCVGDGFTIRVTGVSFVSVLPGDLAPNYSEVSAARSATGIVAMATVTTGIGIEIHLQRTASTFDGGEEVTMQVDVSVEMVSEHADTLSGENEIRTQTFRISLTDPWAWGSSRPNYRDDCSCTPVY